MNPNSIRLRFAPSPTGHLHIGGVRTALFNYLYTQNQSGVLVLRIEDTDVSRSCHEMAKEILASLEWLGIHWDEGPFYQSDRFHLYKNAAMSLLQQGKAYRCFCTPGEIEARRNNVSSNDPAQQIYKYDRYCLGLTQAQIEEKLAQNIPFVTRFFIPTGTTYFKDRLHKELKIDNDQLEDFVILKSDQSPTYHLSVVVDDMDMAITDVIRGDDHLSNTFKQILLYQALQQKPPKFAHLPLILGPDKKKLSKRHGETSVLEFKRSGYLPIAIVNYLAQLSWLPSDSQRLYSMEELARLFSLAKVNKNSPVFDYDKLRFLNSRAIQEKEDGELCQLLENDSNFKNRFTHVQTGKKIELIHLVKPRIKTLDEFIRKFELYLPPHGAMNYENPDKEKLLKDFSAADVVRYTRLFLENLGKMEDSGFTASMVEAKLRSCAEENQVKASDLIHPCRFALTSETVSPSIFDVFAFFGKAESCRRLEMCAAFFASQIR